MWQHACGGTYAAARMRWQETDRCPRSGLGSPGAVQVPNRLARYGWEMDENRARELLSAKRAEVMELLRATESAAAVDLEQEGPGDYGDAAQPLVAQAEDEAVAERLRERLAAIDQALGRLEAGTYGKSVLSGQPIPDERLEADPAAELTVEEADPQRYRG